MAVTSYFVDQDEDINAAYGFEDEYQLYQALNMRNKHGQFTMNIGATSILDQTYQDEDINAAYGFEDEYQLYQALNMRNKHGQFTMNIGATSILDQTYLDDDDDSQDSSDDDDTSQDNSDDDFDQLNWMMTQMRHFLTTSWLQLLKLKKPEELTLNIFPRFGESVMKIPKGPLMSLPKHPLKLIIQPYPETTLPMIGCSGTRGSRTFSSWIPSLQPRKVANHLKVILLVNFLSLIKDSFTLFQ